MEARASNSINDFDLGMELSGSAFSSAWYFVVHGLLPFVHFEERSEIAGMDILLLFCNITDKLSIGCIVFLTKGRYHWHSIFVEV